MAEFMLIFHQNAATYGTRPLETRRQALAEYVAWRMEIEESFIDANKMAADKGRCLLFHNGEVRVIDGPYAEAKEVIGGYVLFRAANYEEALKIARDCPFLKYGSRIELREVDSMAEKQLWNS
ncbi:MAG: hypothetical protein ETSY1_18665 [Candidatus Entotheonella factor]|uniref:YCII-related domain-containing protein n=1 Tax=Entotheonella factor TaxID=1429438 RepID=W4LM64_ENTF1|nr:MAG: hypothetical protein ETSY1_18665 [Candidatus Entotheonella factor]